MSSNSQKSPRYEDLNSTEDDTLGTSFSLSVGDNSIRIREKPKVVKKVASEDKHDQEKWWLKKPDTWLDVSNVIPMDAKLKQSPSPSPDVSSSMKEFLEKEKMCKAMHKNEIEMKETDDTLCDILASAAFDKYPSDFENATDEDIGSILEEMSKIAGALSPNSSADRSKSRNSAKNTTEEEKSVEELLEEAEKLVRKNSSSLSKSGSKSDTLVPENTPEDVESLNRVKQLEADIFQLIEEEVHKETEKIRKSPKNEKKRENSPGYDVVYESVNGLKAPKSLELQRRKFEEQKVEVSSSSDLDDPIERHSKSEDLKSTRKMESDKDSLHKEITDVDKDFFEDLLRKSKERAEGGISGSSSFGQEDFSHFLKLLQVQTDKKEKESNDLNPSRHFLSKPTDEKTSLLDGGFANDKSPEFPEKEISDILEKELPGADNRKVDHEIIETDSSLGEDEHKQAQSISNSGRSESKVSNKKDQPPPEKTPASKDDKNILNEELYTVGRTPRLELFADAIEKLLAEKTVDNTTQQSKEPNEERKAFVRKTISNTEIKSSSNLSTTHRSNVERKPVHPSSATSNKPLKKELKFSKSKSYDQICKPPSRTSVENPRAAKPMDTTKKPANYFMRRSPTLKPRLQPTVKPITKIPPKNKLSSKPKKDPVKTGSTLTLSSTNKGDQLRTKNDFITDRLQAMTTAELQLKKQVEDLSVKLSSKTEQLRLIKREFDRIQQNVLPLEKELLELRVKEGNFQEKLQVARSHVEREKQLTQKLKDQVIIDSRKITDLNRQIREMERILRRKNPDSVSALILTANSEQDKIGAEKVKLLEDRIASLENETKAKEDLAQQKLIEFQKKFTDMKEKYAAQIVELEEKLLEANIKNRKVYNDMFTQTVTKPMENKSVETIRKQERTGSFEKEEKKEQKSSAKPTLKSQNSKDDAYLMATIRGLKLELTNKDKTVSKLTKEFQEIQKTNRRLQKEREKLLNDRRSVKSMDIEKMNRGMVSSDSKLSTLKSTEGNDQNSNVYQNGYTSDANTQRLSASMQKLYDPMQYTENEDSNLVKRLTDENDILKEELSKMNKDFMALKNKRLHDLNLLQEEHEREMAALLKEYSVKFGDSKVVKLQGQINTQVAVISHLKQQIEKMRDYKEQVVVLKAEREHLESKVKSLNEKVKYLSTPSTEQLQLLQDKITILQQRHESREMTLQSLVRDLLRNKNQCKDCKNEKGKNRQLCYFRQELDNILGMLQEIANVH
ncbi:Protein QN1 like protein [Habropoda laboriosa]|uniref:Centrosomal protein of 162 kDa n=1 Tax=Habropoda laboriosa TaxID=597456 RepID=A0A0L7RCD1_9HYME|nr:Protein QN1 like protein [Habropoda laboriosa]